MTRKVLCHPQKVKKQKAGYTVELKFDHQMFCYIQEAAKIYTNGCVCDLVGTLFLDRFEDLTREVMKKSKDSKLDA